MISPAKPPPPQTHHNEAIDRRIVKNKKIRQGNESTLTNGIQSKSSWRNSTLVNEVNNQYACLIFLVTISWENKKTRRMYWLTPIFRNLYQSIFSVEIKKYLTCDCSTTKRITNSIADNCTYDITNNSTNRLVVITIYCILAILKHEWNNIIRHSLVYFILQNYTSGYDCADKTVLWSCV